MKILSSALLLAACAFAANAQTPAPPSNPFFQQSALPYQFPPFDQIKDSDFRAAFDAGMAEQRREVDAIVRDAGTPTFDNTIVALERSGGPGASSSSAIAPIMGWAAPGVNPSALTLPPCGGGQQR